MDRYSYCIFCDDIREEVGNKISMIGVYRGELQVAVVPTLLSKLCVAIYCDTSVDRLFQSLSTRISVGDKILREDSIPQEALVKMQAAAAEKGSSEDPIQRIAIGMQMLFSPFVIEKESTLVVTAIMDGEERTAGKLRLRHNPDLAQ
jgi:hypothetical protein